MQVYSVSMQKKNSNKYHFTQHTLPIQYKACLPLSPATFYCFFAMCSAWVRVHLHSHKGNGDNRCHSSIRACGGIFR